MNRRLSIQIIFVAALVYLVGPAAHAGTVAALDPVIYTVKAPAPDTHYAEIEARVPTGRRAAIEMMMAVWSPGFYRVEDYASRVEGLSARKLDGTALQVERTRKNRWQIQTSGAPVVIVSYRLLCNARSVTTNWVGEDFAVLNGAATFIRLVEQARRPAEVRLELPTKWTRAMTALDRAPGGLPNHYRAADFDTLVDSPIVAGPLAVREFEVDGSKHFVVNAGNTGEWDGGRAARDLEKIVREHRRMWGFLPFKRYHFLFVFRQGGGGLEHKNSTLVTTNPESSRTAGGYLSWLGLASHEYFHAFNVKRLRPVELGPFDYENPPRTTSLWISEGLTSYYGDLMAARTGLYSPQDFLSRLSSRIKELQNSPGRLLQTLEQSSYDVWNNSFSGVNPSGATVSYYVKGQVVGFLLDAKIRRVTDGKKSLDDVMRLAYKRYSGERGFTPEQFRKTAEEVTGVSLTEWFGKAVSSVDELDYREALDWFGLRFASPAGQESANSWKLEIRDDSTESQKGRLRALLGQTDK